MQSLKKIHAWAQMQVPLLINTRLLRLGHCSFKINFQFLALISSLCTLGNKVVI